MVPDPLHVLLGTMFLAFLSGLLTMIAGFGGNLVLVPLAALLIGTREAVVLGLLVGCVNPLLITLGHYRTICLRDLGKMLLGALPFAVPGIMLHRMAPETVLTLMIAVVALGAGIRNIRPPVAEPGEAGRGRLRHLLLPLGGFIQGAIGTSGPLFVAWLASVAHDKARFRSTICAFWIIINPPLVALLVFHSDTPVLHLWRATWCLPAVGLAYIAGNRLHDRLHPRSFQRFVVVLLLVAGLTAAVRAGLGMVG